jgi:hypothetical protein
VSVACRPGLTEANPQQRQQQRLAATAAAAAAAAAALDLLGELTLSERVVVGTAVVARIRFGRGAWLG